MGITIATVKVGTGTGFTDSIGPSN